MAVDSRTPDAIDAHGRGRYGNSNIRPGPRQTPSRPFCAAAPSRPPPNPSPGSRARSRRACWPTRRRPPWPSGAAPSARHPLLPIPSSAGSAGSGSRRRRRRGPRGRAIERSCSEAQVTTSHPHALAALRFSRDRRAWPSSPGQQWSATAPQVVRRLDRCLQRFGRRGRRTVQYLATLRRA